MRELLHQEDLNARERERERERELERERERSRERDLRERDRHSDRRSDAGSGGISPSRRSAVTLELLTGNAEMRTLHAGSHHRSRSATAVTHRNYDPLDSPPENPRNHDPIPAEPSIRSLTSPTYHRSVSHPRSHHSEDISASRRVFSTLPKVEMKSPARVIEEKETTSSRNWRSGSNSTRSSLGDPSLAHLERVRSPAAAEEADYPHDDSASVHSGRNEPNGSYVARSNSQRHRSGTPASVKSKVCPVFLSNGASTHFISLYSGIGRSSRPRFFHGGGDQGPAR